MPNPRSLADVPVAAAATWLAKRAALVRLLQRAGVTKKAGLHEWLQRAGGQVKELHQAQPWLGWGALGAGLGGAAGYGLGEMRNRDGEEEQVSPWSSALTGALAGGGMGAGLAALAQGRTGLAKLTPQQELMKEYKTRLAKAKGGTWGQIADTSAGIAGDVATSRPAAAYGAGLAATLTPTGLRALTTRSLSRHLEKVVDPVVLQNALGRSDNVLQSMRPAALTRLKNMSADRLQSLMRLVQQRGYVYGARPFSTPDVLAAMGATPTQPAKPEAIAEMRAALEARRTVLDKPTLRSLLQRELEGQVAKGTQGFGSAGAGSLRPAISSWRGYLPWMNQPHVTAKPPKISGRGKAVMTFGLPLIPALGATMFGGGLTNEQRQARAALEVFRRQHPDIASLYAAIRQ